MEQADRRLAPSATVACLVLGLLVVTPLTGCRRFTKEGADREVYGILDAVRTHVPPTAGPLDVDAADRVAQAARCSASYRLTLRDALALAAAASRDYLSERETVYLAALSLTGAQNEFHPIFGAGGTGEVLARHTTTGLPTDGSRFRGDVDADVSRAFETGGGLVLGLASNFLKNLASSDPFGLAQTLLTADILVPLARGSGWVARENLIQAERDTLYAMRDFARFQQEFTVRITSRYYALIQLRDVWRNEEAAYESLDRLLEQQTALGATGAGRIPDFQVDQTKQDLLRADERRLLARIGYTGAVDDFKLLLGIPMTVPVEIPEDELKRLQAEGLRQPKLPQDEAIELAVERRLDLDNARGEEVDAWRRVLVAKNGLGPQVDLRLGGTLRTLETHPLDLRDTEVETLFGLDIDLPLQRTAERNAYRAAIIQAARARRARQGFEDGVILDVREAYRRLERSKRSYEIQEAGVELSERRVESTTLLLAAGKAETRDRLEAEEARVRARNAVTLALISHAVARMEFELAMGVLEVREDASWVELPWLDENHPPAGPRSHPAPPPPPPCR